MSKLRFVGLDVHADTIAVAVAEPDGEVRSHGVIPNRPASIRKLASIWSWWFLRINETRCNPARGTPRGRTDAWVGLDDVDEA